ncbi:MAG: GNAT family N-acetyltransferase [Bacteroidota bacterium]
MKNLKLSNPTKGDKDALMKHFVETITDTVKKEEIQNKDEVIKSGVEEQMANLERYFSSNSGIKENYLIAKLDSRIIGTIAYGRPSKLLLNTIKEELMGIPEIKSVYILPEFQRTGIGNFLFTEIKTMLKKSQISQYCLDCGYTKSQKYWKKRLGEPQYLLKDYWSKNNDHMIWKLPI